MFQSPEILISCVFQYINLFFQDTQKVPFQCQSFYKKEIIGIMALKHPGELEQE